MANLKNITELPVAESAEGLNLIVNDGGAAKQIAASAVGAQADWAETNENSPAFIKNKPTKELMYEWNFSADDEVYEIFENVDDDLSWLTKKQEGVNFEIIVEAYGYTYLYNDENGYHDYTYYEDIFSTLSSVDTPYYSRFTNVPVYDFSFFVKEVIVGGIGTDGVFLETKIDDTTTKYFRLNSWCNFDIENGTHIDTEIFAPVAVENGGLIIFFTEGNPFKSIKIYKII